MNSNQTTAAPEAAEAAEAATASDTKALRTSSSKWLRLWSISCSATWLPRGVTSRSFRSKDSMDSIRNFDKLINSNYKNSLSDSLNLFLIIKLLIQLLPGFPHLCVFGESSALLPRHISLLTWPPGPDSGGSIGSTCRPNPGWSTPWLGSFLLSVEA